MKNLKIGLTQTQLFCIVKLFGIELIFNAINTALCTANKGRTYFISESIALRIDITIKL
jgi:hypothetical protein